MKSLRAIVALFALCIPDVTEGSEFTGIVKDESGGVVAGATITVLTARQAVVIAVTSDAAGAFTVPVLEPGEYLVRVQARGFTTRDMALTYSGTSPPATIILSVAAVEEAVTVTSTPGLAEDRNQALQFVSVITRDQVDLRARTVVAQAVAEETGVHLQQTSPTMAGIFIRGLTGNKVNVFVDGVRFSNGAQRGGVNTFLNLIDQSAVDRIEVIHGPSSAEYGSDALGGSVQFLTRTPELAASGTRIGGEVGAGGQTAHQGGGGNAAISIGKQKFGLFASAGGRKVGDIRTGDGIDSHAAATRFLGVPSSAVMTERLPDTGFQQMAGMLKANWTPSPRTQLVTSYAATRQDQGDRYDQLLGGDGNLISQLNDLRLDLFYARLERSGLGWFDHGTVTYAINSQREERVNQGGQGSKTATIGHEPERTTSNAVTASISKTVSARQTLQLGGDLQREELVSDSFNVNPVTGAVSARRPRVPSHATFTQGGAFAQTTFAANDRLRLVGALRAGSVSYTASAAEAPVVSGKPLWPDDSFSTSSLTFRAGAVFTPAEPWAVVASASRGFRAPHMTDLGTLGLTGSGFEVASPDVAGRNAMVGTTADATAIATGDPVVQLVPESSFNVEGSVRYSSARGSASFTVFVNHIYDNIAKQTLILPPGAVGTSLGTEAITAQNANGAVFVAAAATPVLVRANFDNARSWGVEHQGRFKLAPAFTLQTVFTYYEVKDTATGLAPNIEGGVPAPDGYVMLQYAPAGGRWWVQPYLHAAAEQSNLSSLDLTDRRTASPRNRTNMRAFFLNGATNRGWVAAGPDGAIGTADDVLTATGETLAQIQDRVLGVGVNSGVLFSAVPGYVAFGVRGGLRLGPHQVLIDVENLTDKNYRGISWGIDAPGRGIAVRYVARF
ncbi:MAG: TonB-dependent receptor [Vicinamibacterales bacterium]